MSIISRFESGLGLTRADVTVGLFLAAASLFGFLYVTFFDRKGAPEERGELLAMQLRYDSIVAAQKARRDYPFDRSAALVDSISRTGEAAALPASVRREMEKLDTAAGADNRQGGDREPRYQPKPQPTGPVNINTATEEQLQTLPGVGQATAAAITAHRHSHPFGKIEDIQDVKGIGEKKFARMKHLLRVR